MKSFAFVNICVLMISFLCFVNENDIIINSLQMKICLYAILANVVIWLWIAPEKAPVTEIFSGKCPKLALVALP